MKHFKSIKKIREADIEQLDALPGITHTAAEAVYNYFRNQKTAVR
jgi:excinuclease UvrABC nuclease subunit